MTQQQRTSEHTNSNKRLSVQITLTGLSFLITHSESQEFVYFTETVFDTTATPEEIQEELTNALQNDAELTTDFEEVVLLYATPLYTVVPDSLFDETKASEYLKFNSKILAGDFIAHDHMESIDAVVVYVPFININNIIYERFGSFRYYHASSVLLKKFKTLESRSQEGRAYLNMQRDRFDLYIFDHGSLQLCNSFQFDTPEDFIYYVLFALEQLKLNPNTLPLVLMGHIEKDDDNFRILYTYVRDLSFFDSSWLDFKRFSDESPHRHLLQKILV